MGLAPLSLRSTVERVTEWGYRWRCRPGSPGLRPCTSGPQEYRRATREFPARRARLSRCGDRAPRTRRRPGGRAPAGAPRTSGRASTGLVLVGPRGLRGPPIDHGGEPGGAQLLEVRISRGDVPHDQTPRSRATSPSRGSRSVSAASGTTPWSGTRSGTGTGGAIQVKAPLLERRRLSGTVLAHVLVGPGRDPCRTQADAGMNLSGQLSAPVAMWGAPTGLDSGEPRCLR